MNPLVPGFILREDAAGRTAGSFAAAALFIDIPGFTQLTETLLEHGRAGAEALAGTLRFYFDPLIAAVHDAGGFVSSFAGDAFTALFPAPRAGPERDAADRALRAAIAMRRFFEAHPVRETPFGAFPFSFKVGLSWGRVAWGVVRASPTRSYFYFQGPAIDACASIEQRAHSGDVLLDEAFLGRVDAPGAAPIAGDPPAWRLVASDAPPRAPLPRDARGGGGERFVDPAVAGAPPLGEFRNVASVFLSFSDVAPAAAAPPDDAAPPPGPRAPGFPELILLIHELSTLYGGTFTGVDAGDKGTTALVHFGAPISHENDAERALDFALEVRARAPSPVRVRAGITCDIRYAGFNGGTERHDYACIGRATNLAARLVMAAPWGEIWCDEQTLRSVDDHYQWSSRRARRFKGFEASVQVYALERRRVSVQRQVSDLGLIGRDAELRRLWAMVAPLLGAGQGEGAARVMHVDGEAGLGKSYLVESFHRELREARPARRLLWLDARCDQTIRSSLNAVEYALRGCFLPAVWVDRDERRACFEEGLAGLLSRLPEDRADLREAIERARPILASLVGIRAGSEGPRSQRGLQPGEPPAPRDPGAPEAPAAGAAAPAARPRFDEILVALCAYFRAECATRPVVLYLEDAHWADEDSLAAIAAVVRACKDLPLAVICTSRRGDDGTPLRLPIDPEIPSEVMELGPLREPHLVAIASAVFGGAVPKMMVDLLRENAGGNPLYAQEILSYWLADKGQTMSSITGTFSPPRSITSLLVARLDRLEPGVRATVLAASVLGREFELAVLARMLPATSALERHIRVGEMHCIWRAVDDADPVRGEGARLTAPLAGRRYQFTNVMLCSAAYEMQSKARLRDLHRLAAEAILSVHGKDDAHLTALARHFYRAGALTESMPYFLAAARKAEERDALEEARRLYRAYEKITLGDGPPSVFAPPLTEAPAARGE
ncbi:MAG: AAA family ATPase [Polyangiaceae bacterium]|nr:AAA family ATPase [Polyangiaceae bacterium]